MLKVAVFGGGRWARSLVSVLTSVLPPDAEVLWITKHLQAPARLWLAENSLPQVSLQPEVDWASLKTGSAAVGAIVATSPERHFAIAHQALSYGIATLCEKPIAPTLEQAEKLFVLANEQGCPFGIHLEFLYASYLEQFAAQIPRAAVESVHIQWLDPPVEQRQGEAKYPELFTDIANEQLPHCWSILTQLFPGEFQLTSVEATAEATLVHAQIGPVAVSCELSRCAPRRTRRVSINGGVWLLDFSSEPGFVQTGDRVEQLDWTGRRPLERSLGDFRDVISGALPVEKWPLSHALTATAARASLQAARLLREIQDRQIAALALCSYEGVEDPACLRLICDRLLPELAEQGLRFAPRNDSERLDFVRYWMHHLSKKT